MMKIGIIDYNKQERSITKSLLKQSPQNEEQPPIEILFDADRIDTLDITSALRPDILLVDIESQPDRIVAQLNKALPDCDIVILTNLSEPTIVRDSFRNGAVSYLLKRSSMDYLHFAVTVTSDQGSFVSPEICRALIDQAYLTKQYEDLLTAREQQVAQGIAEGLSYKMIAGQHNISLDTVRAYVKRVYRKLKINSKSELMAQLRL